MGKRLSRMEEREAEYEDIIDFFYGLDPADIGPEEQEMYYDRDYLQMTPSYNFTDTRFEEANGHP